MVDSRLYKIIDFVGVGKTVADLRCRNGVRHKYLNAKEYWGFDNDVALIAEAKAHASSNAQFSVVDIMHFEPGIHFDVVLLIDAASLYLDPIDCVERISRSWKFDRLIFSMLWGDEPTLTKENAVVASARDSRAIKLLGRVKHLYIEKIPDETYSWYLMELRK
jgi:hypothetical protein